MLSGGISRGWVAVQQLPHRESHDHEPRIREREGGREGGREGTGGDGRGRGRGRGSGRGERERETNNNTFLSSKIGTRQVESLALYRLS